jgi:predicted aspartyl protease
VSNFFNIDGELVVVTAHVYGPTSDTIVRLALDTGSVGTVIHPDILTAIGYDLSQPTGQVRIVTASGIEAASRLVLSRIVTLDQQREEFAITCHALPAATNVEGLLGLDFYRQQRRLVIDFRAGEVTLE